MFVDVIYTRAVVGILHKGFARRREGRPLRRRTAAIASLTTAARDGRRAIIRPVS